MTTHDALRLADVDPLVFTERARATQLVGAVALDVAMPLALLVAGIAIAAAGLSALGAILIATALILLGVAVWLLGRTGRTLGAATVDIRVVRRSTGAAAGSPALIALVTGALGAYDLRRGRDPFAPAIAAFAFPVTSEGVVASRPRRGMVPTLALDSGERLSLDSALVLGRDPVAPPDAPAQVYRWADMSRTLSKSHVRFEWDGRQVWVTDLGSTNGTLVRGTGAPTPLLAHQRTPVPGSVTLEIGDRILTIREGGH